MMTKTQLERLERIAVQILVAFSANSGHPTSANSPLVSVAINRAQELIKQLDALAIAE